MISRRRYWIPTVAEPLMPSCSRTRVAWAGHPRSMETTRSIKNFRLSFRNHVSLVSPVSHTLMDKCEVERIPISLTAVEAPGDAHLKRCKQMYHSLALMTRGNVRTLIRAVEESNGAEAWPLRHNRYAPDTQNRQDSLMQKIMIPSELCGRF